MAGADAFTIQKLAGHKSISISQRYVHADLAAKEKAVALLNVLNKPTPKARWGGATRGIISMRFRRKT
jgi:hypothetical protein